MDLGLTIMKFMDLGLTMNYYRLVGFRFYEPELTMDYYRRVRVRFYEPGTYYGLL